MPHKSDFRDIKEYKELLFSMFLEFCKSEEFDTRSYLQKVEVIDKINEINIILESYE